MHEQEQLFYPIDYWLAVDFILIQSQNNFTPVYFSFENKPTRFIIKAYFFIKGYSLKKQCNEEYDLLSLPQGAGL